MNTFPEETTVASHRKLAPLSKLGTGCVIVGALLSIAMLILLFTVVRNGLDAWRRADSTSNLKQLGMVYAIYCNDDREGRFPPITMRGGLAAPELSRFYPDYLTMLSVFFVPSWHGGYEPFDKVTKEWPKSIEETEKLVALNHVYFGYAFSTEDELNALLDAIPQLSVMYPRPIVRPGASPVISLGEAARLAKESPPKIDTSRVVVMFENPRLNGGTEKQINVLYLDGRVAIVPRADFFPNAHFNRLPADPL